MCTRTTDPGRPTSIHGRTVPRATSDDTEQSRADASAPERADPSDQRLRRRVMWLALAAAVAAALGAVFFLVVQPSHAGAAQVKVFVVPAAAPGVPPLSLGSVARQTLGTADRAEEIFRANVGLRQPDGAAVSDPAAPLHPDWVLRLPDDASGTAVQLAHDDRGPARGGAVTLPLAAVIASAACVVLALVTVIIVLRRQATLIARTTRRVIHSLGEPGRRRRRLRFRQAIGRRFDAHPDEAAQVTAELRRLPGGPELAASVHAASRDAAGLTVWTDLSAPLPAPWQQLGATRWWIAHSIDGAVARQDAVPQGPALAADWGTVCLVRVGADQTGAAVLVDLSRLDGILAVSGEASIAHQLVEDMAADAARTRPGTPVQVFERSATPPRRSPREAEAHTRHDVRERPVRATAGRRPVRGLLLERAPDRQRLDDLVTWSAADDWTVLAAGDVPHAHWSWHVQEDGTITIPVLGLDLVAASRSRISASSSRG